MDVGADSRGRERLWPANGASALPLAGAPASPGTGGAGTGGAGLFGSRHDDDRRDAEDDLDATFHPCLAGMGLPG